MRRLVRGVAPCRRRGGCVGAFQGLVFPIATQDLATGLSRRQRCPSALAGGEVMTKVPQLRYAPAFARPAMLD